MRIGVVTDQRLRIQDGHIVSGTPLTGPLLALCADSRDRVSFLARMWEGAAESSVPDCGNTELWALPEWHMLEAARAIPRAVMEAVRWLRSQDAVVLVMPSLSGLIVGSLLILKPSRRAQPFIVVTRTFLSDAILMRLRAHERLVMRPMLRVMESITRLICRRAQDALFVSSAVRQGYPFGNSKIAPEVDWGALQRVVRTQRRRDRIVYAGRLEVEKNPLLAIQAFAKANLSGIELSIVGDGSQRAMLEEYCRVHGISDVVFEGALSHESVLNVMAQSRLVLVPSLSEAFGLVAFEGLAVGAAVVHSGAGGLDEAVGGNMNAFRVTDLDPEAWANAMLAALSTERATGLDGRLRPAEWVTLEECVNRLRVVIGPQASSLRKERTVERGE